MEYYYPLTIAIDQNLCRGNHTQIVIDTSASNLIKLRLCGRDKSTDRALDTQSKWSSSSTLKCVRKYKLFGKSGEIEVLIDSSTKK